MTTGDFPLPSAVSASIAAGRAAREKLATDMQADAAASAERLNTLAQPPEEAPPVEETEEKPDPLAQLTADLAKKSAAYDTLRGKYDAEVPLLHRLVEELRADVATLKNVENNPKKSLTKERKPASVTDEERKEYGNDMIDVIGRRAQEVFDAEFGPELEELRNKLASAETKLEKVDKGVAAASQTALRGSLEAHLDRHVPHWLKQDGDPEFVAWLREADTFTGLPRLQLLANARDEGQFGRVEAIFKGYLQASGKSYGEPPKSPTPDPKQLNGSVKLDTLVAPTTRARNSKMPEQAPQAVSRSDIAKFYSDVNRGKYAGREAEVNAIKERILQAVARGDVTA